MDQHRAAVEVGGRLGTSRHTFVSTLFVAHYAVSQLMPDMMGVPDGQGLFIRCPAGVTWQGPADAAKPGGPRRRNPVPPHAPAAGARQLRPACRSRPAAVLPVRCRACRRSSSNSCQDCRTTLKQRQHQHQRQQQSCQLAAAAAPSPAAAERAQAAATCRWAAADHLRRPTHRPGRCRRDVYLRAAAVCRLCSVCDSQSARAAAAARPEASPAAPGCG